MPAHQHPSSTTSLAPAGTHLFIDAVRFTGHAVRVPMMPLPRRDTAMPPAA